MLTLIRVVRSWRHRITSRWFRLTTRLRAWVPAPMAWLRQRRRQAATMNDALSVRLRNLNAAWFVLLLLAATYLAALPLPLLEFAFPAFQLGDGPPSMRNLPIVGRLIYGSIIAPLIETALFQALPIGLLRGKLELSWPVVLVTSAGLFGASHGYSAAYVIFAFLIGLVLAYGYAVRKQDGGRPFLLITVVHGLRNGVASFLP
jgi:uncharacterized protein